MQEYSINNRQGRRINYVFLVTGIVLIILTSILFSNETVEQINIAYGKVFVILTILLNVIMLLKAIKRKNIISTILFIFLLLPSYTFKYYYYDHMYISYHQIGINRTVALNTVLSTYFLFLYVLSFTIDMSRMKKKGISIRNIHNPILFYLNVIVVILFILFANTSASIFSTGGYAKSLHTGDKSSLNEYAIIFLLGAILFSGKSKAKRNVIFVVAAMYCLKNILTGGRLETIMVVIMLTIIYFSKKWSYYAILCAIIVGYFAFSIFGYIRSDITKLDSLSDIVIAFFSSANRGEAVSSTSGDVIYGSQRMLLLIADGHLTIPQRFASFIYFVLSFFLPTSYLPESAVLSTYRVDLYSSGGGGLFPTYFFVYGGYIGVLFISFFLSGILNRLNAESSSRNGFGYFFAILAISTLPRWLLYSPITLFKLSLWGAAFLSILILIHNRMIYESPANKFSR